MNHSKSFESIPLPVSSAHRSRSSPPSRWLEPNNRELILLFESYLVHVFLHFAPLRLFTPLSDPNPLASPLLCLIIRFFPSAVSFRPFRSREREMSASWPAVLVRAQILLLLRSNDIQASSLHPLPRKFDIPVERLVVVVRGNFRRNETRCSLYHLYTILDGSASFRLVSENNVEDTKFHVAWNSILVKVCFQFVSQISNTISF